SSFAEFERDIISERTRFGMAEKAKEGGVITKAPLGYKIHEGKLMIDEDKKKEIQDIFNEYVGTERSLNAIAREHKLSVAGLIKILRNRAYIGEVKFKDNYPGAHESILDKELFTNVQAKLDSNSYERENLRNKNFLTGLDPSMNQDYLSRLALELSKGSIKCERKKLKSEDIKPSDDELSELPGSYKLQKYVATSLLVEEGFDAEDISYDRVFVNADRADIHADSDERKVYVDCTTTNIHKILDYLESEIEYWLILEDGPDSMQCYMFRKIQD
ncbi:MAG: recombinase family protein, partial [Candidatus Woesearchaeota archaeon]